MTMPYLICKDIITLYWQSYISGEKKLKKQSNEMGDLHYSVNLKDDKKCITGRSSPSIDSGQ